jgi:sugar phosphate isomerase/epimerase
MNFIPFSLVTDMRRFFVLGCAAILCGNFTLEIRARAADAPSSLWSHDNLVAWCVVPFDAKHRDSEERAEMLQRLGFKYFAYDWRDKDVPTFSAEIDALQKHGIDLLGWWLPPGLPDARFVSMLEIFKAHHVHPQLWLMHGGTFTHTPAEQQLRVDQEADSVAHLQKIAAPYGCKIELYSHNNWFGNEDNELAIINRLKELGITDVGMVYNFSHAHDKDHDDTVNFPDLWKRIQSHVVAVNITGMGPVGNIYLSQGSHEMDMMRTIQDSGWHGPIGLIAEKGGDAEVTLKNFMIGLDWLAAEINSPGSGGPRPFPLIPDPPTTPPAPPAH